MLLWGKQTKKTCYCEFSMGGTDVSLGRWKDGMNVPGSVARLQESMATSLGPQFNPGNCTISFLSFGSFDGLGHTSHVDLLMLSCLNTPISSNHLDPTCYGEIEGILVPFVNSFLSPSGCQNQNKLLRGIIHGLLAKSRCPLESHKYWYLITPNKH